VIKNNLNCGAAIPGRPNYCCAGTISRSSRTNV